MTSGRIVAWAVALPLFATVARAQAPLLLPVLDDKPSPRVDAGGPSAAVTALAFGADGKTLYGAGLDKVVRLWARQQDGHFVLKSAFRVPIGPGNAGAINAVAVSPDGAWLAMAGRAPFRGELDFRLNAVFADPAVLSPERNQDVGVIYVASTANPAGGKVLRGHAGEVWALAFAPPRKGKPPLLVSAAIERNGTRLFGALRLWDVDAGKALAECHDDLPSKRARPALAVWHTGQAATQLRVAVAWPEEKRNAEGYFRLWDPGAKAVDALQSWKAGAFFCQTAALLGHDGRADILFGDYRFQPVGGRLQIWHVNDRDGSVTYSDGVAFPPINGVAFRPVSLAVVSGPGVPGANYAAVILEPGDAGAFHLALVDLRVRQVVASVPLMGSDKTHLPALAAGGGHIAVAATGDHAVRVYSVADLLRHAGPRDLLGDVAWTPRQVAFVDEGRGLWLSGDERAHPLESGLVFDLAKRQLRPNGSGLLVADAPASGDWKVAIDKDRKVVRVSQGQRQLPPVRFSGEHEVVDRAALRPPTRERPGILAVAYTERDSGRTFIMLCNPADGKPYRRLVGHFQEVRDLAFAASRPLLASVADDQTLCIWSLADLGQASGQIAGLGVTSEAGQVVVSAVEPASAVAKKALAKGDVLEKVGAPGGPAKPVKDAADFLVAVAARQPGAQVEVTVRGKGPVQLPVERAVDARNPLFSLFLLSLRRPALPDWVGWSPAGPYDSSGAAAEAHLGWHTNTSDPAAPVSYVAARTYRNRYYREGILGDLAREADLGRALRAWDRRNPPAPPALRPIPPDAATATGRLGEYLIRQRLDALRVGVNEDHALDEQHVLRWRVVRADGKKVTADDAVASGQAARDGPEWQVNLAAVTWERGEYRVRLGLHARAGEPELASETVTFRFQPPAPAVALHRNNEPVTTTEEQPLTVMQARLALQVVLKEVPARQKVEVTFAQFCNGSPQAAPAARIEGRAAFNEDFELHEGLNRLVVRAVNKGALAGHEMEETGSAELWVRFKPQPEPPPRFVRLWLDTEPEVRASDGKETWVVSQTPVRLHVRIEAQGILTVAAWSAGSQTKSGLPRSEVRDVEVPIELALKAGDPVEVQLRAKSKHSHESRASRRIVYYPPLPIVTSEPLASPDVVGDKITLKGAFRVAEEQQFTLRVRVTSSDGKEAVFVPAVDRKAGKWKAELTLFPGSNNVQVLVANKWRDERAAEGSLKLNYRRPPRITAVNPQNVVAVGTNKVKLAVTVESPVGRPPTAFKVDQKDVPFRPDKPEVKGTGAVWQVELPEVFVNDGERNLDQVQLQAVTEEGVSPVAVVRVAHQQIPQPPRARFLSPAANDTTRRPRYALTFRVESARPLQGVEIRRGDEVLYAADLTKVEREGPLHVLQGEAEVTLRPGDNPLEIVAKNADGRSPRSEVVVGYNPPGALITIDRVELRAVNSENVEEVFLPEFRADGGVSFKEMPRGWVWLVGRVRWSDPEAKALKDERLQVVAKVGDCRQFPVALGAPGKGNEANLRRFRVPLVLIGKTNRIKVEVPTVGQQELSRREFDLQCAAPVTRQRLHVLIVGVDVKNATQLKARVLEALAVEPQNRPVGSQGPFSKNPPFEKCLLYQVLAGEVERGNVIGQLFEINKEIKRLQKESGWLNDVVLIYYEGEDVEVPARKERWLMTTSNRLWRTEPPEKYAIPCHNLPRVPGVQLLLLNVTNTGAVHVAAGDWGGDPDAGLMRYACREPMDPAKVAPDFLPLLGQAMRKKGQLGEVVAYLNQILTQDPKFRPLLVLDDDQKNRRLNGPAE